MTVFRTIKCRSACTLTHLTSRTTVTAFAQEIFLSKGYFGDCIRSCFARYLGVTNATLKLQAGKHWSLPFRRADGDVNIRQERRNQPAPGGTSTGFLDTKKSPRASPYPQAKRKIALSTKTRECPKKPQQQPRPPCSKPRHVVQGTYTRDTPLSIVLFWMRAQPGVPLCSRNDSSSEPGRGLSFVRSVDVRAEIQGGRTATNTSHAIN